MKTIINLAVLIGLPIIGYMMIGWIGVIIGIFIANALPRLPGE